MKIKLINCILWLALLLAMAASISHLAWTFSTVERPGSELLGWVPAVAVDAGLAALAYTIQIRKRAKRPTTILWCGVAGFAIVSALANLYHALSVEQVAVAATAIIWAKAIVLSATLPAMYVFLGEIISGDDAQAVATRERDEQRAQAKEERAQRLAEQQAANETKRIELEQQKQQQTMLLEQQAAVFEQQPALIERPIEQPSTTGVYCERCGVMFKHRQAYAAHGCNKIRSIPQIAAINPSNNHNEKETIHV